MCVSLVLVFTTPTRTEHDPHRDYQGHYNDPHQKVVALSGSALVVNRTPQFLVATLGVFNRLLNLLVNVYEPFLLLVDFACNVLGERVDVVHDLANLGDLFSSVVDDIIHRFCIPHLDQLLFLFYQQLLLLLLVSRK